MQIIVWVEAWNGWESITYDNTPPRGNKGAAGRPFCFGTVKVILSPRAERAQSNPYAVTAEECKR
jgi:hypothetical protein